MDAFSIFRAKDIAVAVQVSWKPNNEKTDGWDTKNPFFPLFVNIYMANLI